jgi:hypothetical protein
MKEIPKILCGMASMRHIIFDGNLLTTLAPELEKLQSVLLTLDVARNVIAVLPDLVFGLEKLLHLDVSGNRLTEIKPAIGRMTTLSGTQFACCTSTKVQILTQLYRTLSAAPCRKLDGVFPARDCAPQEFDGLFMARQSLYHTRRGVGWALCPDNELA